MDVEQLKSILESLIFVSERPVKEVELLESIQAHLDKQSAADCPEIVGASSCSRYEVHYRERELAPTDLSPKEQLQARVSKEESRLSKGDVRQALLDLADDYSREASRGIILVEVAGGWQFRSHPKNAEIIREFFKPKPLRLSRPSLETLAIVAYRQPVTRVEVDNIRSVDSGGVLKTLLERNLVRIVGKKDEPGRPMLYGTTQEFLEIFQLKSLKDLPSLKEFSELEDELHRQASSEGVVLENIEEEEEEVGLDSLAEEADLLWGKLDQDEQEAVDDLESSIKELRSLEKDIFPSEEEVVESQEASDDNSQLTADS